MLGVERAWGGYVEGGGGGGYVEGGGGGGSTMQENFPVGCVK